MPIGAAPLRRVVVSDTRSRLADQASELRLAFDRTFAESPRRDTAPTEDLLALRLGSEPYAVRLSEIAGLFADREITRLPGGATALLGIAGFRGNVVPVYDLHVLLGRSTAKALRWLMVAAGAPVAFAFEAFDGHLRASRDAIVPADVEGQPEKYVREFISDGGLIRPIACLPAILDAIMKHIPQVAPREER